MITADEEVTMTAINGSTAVVTGGQRGLGKALAAQPLSHGATGRQLLSRGATNVYATAPRPHEAGHARLIPAGTDVTDPASVTTLAAATGDATIVINNAGLSPVLYLDDTDLTDAAALFATTFLVPLRVIQIIAAAAMTRRGRVFLQNRSKSAQFRRVGTQQ